MNRQPAAYRGLVAARSPLARRLGAAALLGVVVWKLGVDQSLQAVGAIDPGRWESRCCSPG